MPWIDGVKGALKPGGEDMRGLSSAVGVVRSSTISGFSKSHETPCLTQLPHRGWTSSHLIFRFLHLRHPARDFLCDRRGGMARHGTRARAQGQGDGRTEAASPSGGITQLGHWLVVVEAALAGVIEAFRHHATRARMTVGGADRSPAVSRTWTRGGVLEAFLVQKEKS